MTYLENKLRADFVHCLSVGNERAAAIRTVAILNGVTEGVVRRTVTDL